MNKRLMQCCVILLILFCFNIGIAVAENECEHEYLLANSNELEKREIERTDGGHLYRYYAYWRCSKCGNVAVLPLNRPSFPDEFVPHSYSVKTRHRLSEDGDHVFDLRCAVDGCTLFVTKTHSGTNLYEDQGHVREKVHRYIYRCSECTALIPVEKSCSKENCPVHIYKKQPEVEVE